MTPQWKKVRTKKKWNYNQSNQQIFIEWTLAGSNGDRGGANVKNTRFLISSQATDILTTVRRTHTLKVK